MNPANGRAAGEMTATPAVYLPNWPAEPTREALHGLAGDVVRLIEPASEADPASLLLQFLVAVGNLIGRRPHFDVEGTQHTTNLYVVIVGTTSKGRKGTSWGRVRQLLKEINPEWTDKRIQAGLVSGEGLIEAVADDDDKRDKRLLIMQDEFASVLKIMNREGNILSAVIRSAWDTGNLSSLARGKNALHATAAHISLICHITRDELRRHLTETEAGNGFGNRFLWGMAHRSKSLPDGGTVDPAGWKDLVNRLGDCMECFASKVNELKRDDDARSIWRAEYERLSEGASGMFGVMTNRAEAQVVRLSMIYAVLDCSSVIRGTHLQAALAVWKYCEDSARYIFGGALGDPIADSILTALQAGDGLTRTEISQLFSRNKTANQIDSALRTLQEYGRVRMERSKRDGDAGGRPVERWRAL